MYNELKGDITMKKTVYMILLIFLLAAIYPVCSEMFGLLNKKMFLKVFLELPSVIGIILLITEVIGKISPKTRVKVMLFLKGLITDVSLTVNASFAPDESFDLDNFYKKIKESIINDSQIELFRFEDDCFQGRNIEIRKNGKVVDFIISSMSQWGENYEEQVVLIQFKSLGSRHTSVSRYNSIINDILNKISVYNNENNINVSSLISYEKGNIIMQELLSSSTKIKYSSKSTNFSITENSLEMKSGLSNHKEMVDKALTGKYFTEL